MRVQIRPRGPSFVRLKFIPGVNLSVATQAEAEAGLLDNKVMTPKLVAGLLAGKVGKGDLIVNVRDAPYNAKCDAGYNGSYVASGTDDTDAIQAAINAVGAAGGGEILIPGKSIISRQLTIAHNGVTLVGRGASWGQGGLSQARDCAVSALIAKPGSAPFKMVEVCSGADNGTNPRIRGGGMRDLFLDGQGVATHGVKLISTIQQKFSNVHVVDVTNVGWLLGTFGQGDVVTNNLSLAFNEFYGCTHAGTGKSLVLSGGADGVITQKYNSCYSTFYGFHAAANIELEDCDSNKFFGLTCAGTLTLHGGGTGSYQNGGINNSCRQNTIFGFEGVVIAKAGADGTKPNSRGNVIYGKSGDSYSMPTIEPGADLTVHLNGTSKTDEGGAATWGEAFVGTVCNLATATQATTSGASAVLTLTNANSTSSDFLNAWDAANPTRLTIPQGVKWVRFSAEVAWAVNATGTRYADIIKNGSTAFKWSSDARASVGTFSVINKLGSSWLRVAPGDYFELRAQQTSGAALDVLQGGTYFQAEFK